MILNFAFKRSATFLGGLAVLYEYANALARRGHEVHFTHTPPPRWWAGSGPGGSDPVRTVEDIGWFRFDGDVVHHFSDQEVDPADPAAWVPPADVPDGDVAFAPRLTPRLGLPVGTIQGFGQLRPELEIPPMRDPAPKVCVAAWLVELGVELGVPREQLWHVPNAIDHDRFRTDAGDGPRPYDVAVLYNSHTAKGWNTARSALDAVRAWHPDLRVAVFSFEEPDEALPDWMAFHHRPDQATLAREVYGRSRVFLQPAWWEGFGLTALEAMACGCALVTTDNGGSREYARHEVTALVSPPGDAWGLARSMSSLLGDEARRSALAEAGAAKARTMTWDASMGVLEGHLAEYVADPARFRHPPGPLPDADVEPIELVVRAVGAAPPYWDAVPG